MRLLCWHNWSKWKSYKFSGISYGVSGYLVTGDTEPRQITETRQTRTCSKCGMELHRRVPNGTGVLADQVAP